MSENRKIRKKIAQRIGRGKDPDKVMLANREVNDPNAPSTEEMKTKSQSLKGAMAGLTSAELSESQDYGRELRKDINASFGVEIAYDGVMDGLKRSGDVSDDMENSMYAYRSFIEMKKELLANWDSLGDLEQRFSEVEKDLETLNRIAALSGAGFSGGIHADTSPYDVESFYAIRARVTEKLNGKLGEDLRKSSQWGAEELLRDPDLYATPTRYGKTSPDKTYVLSRSIVSSVRDNPTPERWAAAVEVVGRMMDEGDGDIGAGALADLLRARKEIPSLNNAELPKETIKKYAKPLVDAGIMKLGQ